MAIGYPGRQKLPVSFWSRAARIVLAVVGGYLLAGYCVSWAAQGLIALGMQRGDGFILSALVGFLFYLGLLIWLFSLRHFPTFRESMGWLHTWSGLVVGGLLFAVFWMGTLSVFDREIDRWMMPMTRLGPPQTQFSADFAWARTRDQALGSPIWTLQYPTEREPTARIFFAPAGNAARTVNIEDGKKAIALPRERLGLVHMDPATGEILPDPGTKGGSGFIFPFHWHLMIGEGSFGQWIIGFAGMAMLALIVSGVIIHREIFSQFFTLRARKATGRTLLDLHNVVGVLGLPFHFVITFSGLAIFYMFYFPTALNATHEGGERQLYAESRAAFSRRPAGTPGETASLDKMVADAQALWGDGAPAQLTISHPGDAAGYVGINRSIDDTITYNYHPAYFEASSGALIKYGAIHPVATVQRFIAGLHFIFFRHWVLRWVYFLLGLAGCALIGTGFLFWIQSRRKQHGSVAFVEGMSVGSVTGIILATGVFLIVNRLLPLGIEGRADWEIWLFFLAWIASFAHGWLRLNKAWIEQCWTISAAALIAVFLNAVTTGDNLLVTLSHGQWAVAGTDLVLLATALIAALVARGFRRRAAFVPSLQNA